MRLYPRISHNTGLRAPREVLDKEGRKSNATKNEVKMAGFVLKNNFFEFNNKIK